MPRKALQAADFVGPDVPTTGPAIALEEQAKFAAHQRHLAVVDDAYGVGIDYDRETYIARGQMLVADMGARALEIGRICIGLKEHEPTGEYQRAVERIGIAPRFARKCVAAALKFSGSDAKQLLAGRLSSTKLLELLAEDDDDLEALVDGGVLAGMTIDDVERMSTRELRAALRTERKERADEQASFEEQLERKDKRMNTLERKARAIAKSPMREKAELIAGEISRCATETINAQNELMLALEEFRHIHKEAGEKPDSDLDLRMIGDRKILELQFNKLLKLF